MANVVEIALRGVDQTGPIVAASRKLKSEMQAVGGAFNQVGNIAAAFGNNTLAGLTSRASLLTASFKTMTEVVSNVGLARAGLAGVVLAMGGWVAQRAIAERQRIAEKIEQEIAAHKALEASIKATAAAQKTLNDRIAEGAISGQKAEALKKQLEDLSLMQGARKMGAVIGDPINPQNPVKAVGAIASGPDPGVIAAQKLVQEHHEKAWETLEAIQEWKAGVDAENRQKEDDDWALYESIQDSKRKFEAEELAALKQRQEELAKLAAIEAEQMALKDAASVSGMQVEMDMQRGARLIGLEGLALQKEQDDIYHEERLRQIAELGLSEDESIRLGNLAATEAAQHRMQLNKQVVAATVQGASAMFGNLQTAAAAFGKKGSAMAKGFAITKALIDTYTAANGAYSAMASIPYVGPALGIAAAAAATAAGMANVSAISSQQAHGGLDFVPQDSTFLLKRGEMVLDPGTSSEVREAARDKFGGDSARPVRVTVYFGENMILDTVAAASRDGRIEIDARAVR